MQWATARLIDSGYQWILHQATAILIHKHTHTHTHKHAHTHTHARTHTRTHMHAHTHTHMHAHTHTHTCTHTHICTHTHVLCVYLVARLLRLGAVSCIENWWIGVRNRRLFGILKSAICAAVSCYCMNWTRLLCVHARTRACVYVCMLTHACECVCVCVCVCRSTLLRMMC